MKPLALPALVAGLALALWVVWRASRWRVTCGSSPPTETLHRLARAFGLTPVDLVEALREPDFAAELRGDGL